MTPILTTFFKSISYISKLDRKLKKVEKREKKCKAALFESQKLLEERLVDFFKELKQFQ